MKTTICKSFDFDAAHHLPATPADHKCHRMHGHTYRVELIFEGVPTERDGWFIDYAEIAAAWAPIHTALDHRCLNDIEGLSNPTTEVLAPWIMRHINGEAAIFLIAVRVYESSSTWCEVRR